jgi:hypothetical protein
MNRSTLRSLIAVSASAIVALSVSPLGAAAQSAPSAVLSVDQVRDDFSSQGYQVNGPITWWTNNHVTTFTVFDRAQQPGQSSRVLMVLVYPDIATAQAEIDKAQAREAVEHPDQLTGATGPHLVPGYGPSLVRQNVALVESTQQELNQQYAAELAMNDQAMFGTGQATLATPTPMTQAVDADFLSALDNSIANL